jgi:hypothetical protein
MSNEGSFGAIGAKTCHLHISYSLIAQTLGADLSRGLRLPAGTQAQGKPVYRRMQMINRVKRF